MGASSAHSTAMRCAGASRLTGERARTTSDASAPPSPAPEMDVAQSYAAAVQATHATKRSLSPTAGAAFRGAKA